jgi:hypothetical protein
MCIREGLHVVVEKPWRRMPDTSEVAAEAGRLGRVVAIDFEYCLLEAVRGWSTKYGCGAGLTFGGEFTVPGPNRLGLGALENLGSHLIAVKEFAAPAATLGALRCAYGERPMRRVWLEIGRGQQDVIDFTATSEPILQRFIRMVEDAIGGAPCSLDLAFAERIAAQIAHVGVDVGARVGADTSGRGSPAKSKLGRM